MANKKNPHYTEKVYMAEGDESKVYFALRSDRVISVLVADKTKALREELDDKIKELRSEFGEKINAVRETIKVTELTTAQVRRLPADIEEINLIVPKAMPATETVPEDASASEENGEEDQAHEEDF